ncbi:MAG: hypothetical protein ACR2PA_10265 [Hyphomicrobiaceae bacterium]
MRITTIFPLAAITLLAGCGTVPQAYRLSGDFTAPQSQVDHCSALLAAVRQATWAAGVGDGEAARIAGFPYLRVNRFFAHVGRRFDGKAASPAFNAWVKNLRQLDAEATRIEIRNLPAPAFRSLRKATGVRSPIRQSVVDAVEECAKEKQTELRSVERRRALLRSASVPEDYSDAARTLGVFPLSSIPISVGWENWKQTHLLTFARTAAAVPTTANKVAYVPPVAAPRLRPRDVKALVDRSRDRSLGIPRPSGEARSRLLQNFAPIWLIDGTKPYDRPGHPRWYGGSTIDIDTGQPSVFARIGHTVIDDQVYLQLIYTIWFSERPLQSPADLLGGKLDGVIWRVTLGSDGQPLIYDTIHACGCYHLLFPSSDFRKRFQGRSRRQLREVPAILPTLPTLRRNERIVLHVASATHYVSRVTTSGESDAGGQSQRYKLTDASVLRSLPVVDGRRRSMFQPDGLVAGSDRLERFVLWPSGVKSPGAMRQWGRHAIALVDRRHFDDADLFHQIFGQ